MRKIGCCLPRGKPVARFFNPMSPHTSARMRSRGFTLVELLAVIAIIAVLALLMFVGVGGIRSRMDQTTCANNMRQTAQGILLYAADNRGYFPPVNDSPDAPFPAPNSWVNIVPKLYLGQQTATEAAKMEVTRRVMRCPTNRAIIVEGTTGVSSEAEITSIHQLRTFAMNAFLGPKTTMSGGVVTNVANRWRTLASVQRPSRTIMLSESMLSVTSSLVSCQAELNPGTIVNSLRALDGSLREGVHGKSNNIAWCDGHVSPWENVRLLVDTNGPYREGKSDDRWRND